MMQTTTVIREGEDDSGTKGWLIEGENVGVFPSKRAASLYAARFLKEARAALATQDGDDRG